MMNCKKCNTKLDPKFRKCPVCGNKISWSERNAELQIRRKSAKGRQRLLVGNVDIAEMRKKEKIKAYFGRGNRNKDARSKDIIPVIIAGVLLIVILLSASNSGKAKDNKDVVTVTGAAVSENAGESQATLTDAQNEAIDYNQTESDQLIPASEGDASRETASPLDATEMVSPEDQKAGDLRNAAYIYLVIDNILKNGSKQYSSYLLDNKNMVIVVNGSMLEDDPEGAYNCIWDNLGSKEVLPQYRDEGAEYFSFYIDDEEVLHICIATPENEAAYELLPEISEEYKTN